MALEVRYRHGSINISWFLMYLFYLIFVKNYNKVESKVENKTTTKEKVTPHKTYKEQHVFSEFVKQVKEEREARGVEVLSPVSYNQVVDNQAKCPNCMSTSLHADKKGFGYGKAVIGGLAIGGWGLFAGGIGAKKCKCNVLIVDISGIYKEN